MITFKKGEPQVVNESLRAVVVALRAGRVDGRALADEVEAYINSLVREEIPCGRAVQQLGILADMLDDGMIEINERRAKYIASEMRKFLGWIK